MHIITIYALNQSQPVLGNMLSEKTINIELDMSKIEATTFKRFGPEW